MIVFIFLYIIGVMIMFLKELVNIQNDIAFEAVIAKSLFWPLFAIRSLYRGGLRKLYYGLIEAWKRT